MREAHADELRVAQAKENVVSKLFKQLEPDVTMPTSVSCKAMGMDVNFGYSFAEGTVVGGGKGQAGVLVMWCTYRDVRDDYKATSIRLSGSDDFVAGQCMIHLYDALKESRREPTSADITKARNMIDAAIKLMRFVP